MRLAVLDIGSNTAHLVVVEPGENGAFTQVGAEQRPLRLAEAAFPARALPAEVETRLTDTVAEMKAAGGTLGADALVAFATSAIREVGNGIEVLSRVRQATGVEIRVLPGSEEARLTYLAAHTWVTGAAFSARKLLVIDIGGGSLEVAGGSGPRPEFAESLPLGSTRLSRRFVRSDPVTEQELVALRGHALALLAPLAERIRSSTWDVVCATSRVALTLGDLARALPEVPAPRHDFGFVGIDGRSAGRLGRDAVNVLAGLLAATSARERAELPGLDEPRADAIVAGSQVAALVMQAFGLHELVLAPWALREGVIIEELATRSPHTGPADAGGDPRRRAVLEFARRYAWDGPHCETVTRLALSLFDQTRSLHGLGPAERELLEYAALMHDVGYGLSQSAHHKHSLYLIRTSGLDGFTERELLVMANIARYHRKALPAGHHADYIALDEDDRRLVRQLAALLRVADGLDQDHMQVVSDVRVRANGGAVRLELAARDTPDLSLWSAERNADLFEEVFQTRLEPVATEVL